MQPRKNIASRYLHLAKMLHCHPVIICECILNAFIFYASRDLYELLLITARHLYPQLKINAMGQSTKCTGCTTKISSTIQSETIRKATLPLLNASHSHFLSWTMPWAIFNQHCRTLLALEIVNETMSINYHPSVIHISKSINNF